jgi:hypothetical protein
MWACKKSVSIAYKYDKVILLFIHRHVLGWNCLNVLSENTKLSTLLEIHWDTVGKYWSNEDTTHKNSWPTVSVVRKSLATTASSRDYMWKYSFIVYNFKFLILSLTSPSTPYSSFSLSCWPEAGPFSLISIIQTNVSIILNNKEVRTYARCLKPTLEWFRCTRWDYRHFAWPNALLSDHRYWLTTMLVCLDKAQRYRRAGARM